MFDKMTFQIRGIVLNTYDFKDEGGNSVRGVRLGTMRGQPSIKCETAEQFALFPEKDSWVDVEGDINLAPKTGRAEFVPRKVTKIENPALANGAGSESSPSVPRTRTPA